MSRQCKLAGVSRSWFYAQRDEVVDEDELTLLRLIDAQYARRPFYGTRRMVVYLREQGERALSCHPGAVPAQRGAWWPSSV